ncbi:MAG: hypothetical protein IJX77_07935 [Ruminococcus sp.]|nr:hypothetical protein [Ruminococcus sp.]
MDKPYAPKIYNSSHYGIVSKEIYVISVKKALSIFKIKMYGGLFQLYVLSLKKIDNLINTLAELYDEVEKKMLNTLEKYF